MNATLKVVLDQMDVWCGWFRWRIDGLTDDEYFWEPAPISEAIDRWRVD